MAVCKFECPYNLAVGTSKHLLGKNVCLYTEQIQPVAGKYCNGRYHYDNNTGIAKCHTLDKSIAIPTFVANPVEVSKRKEIIKMVKEGGPMTAEYILAQCLPSTIPIENVSFIFKHQLFGLYLSGAIRLRRAI